MCVFYVLWKREFEYGYIGVIKGGADGRGVGGGGEDGDGGGAAEEEAGEVEEGDGVALCHERENGEVWALERTHGYSLLIS